MEMGLECETTSPAQAPFRPLESSVLSVLRHQLVKGHGFFADFGFAHHEFRHIIFNDDIDNIKKDRWGKGVRLDWFTGEKNSAVQIVTFDTNGKHTEKTLLKNEDAEIVVVPNASLQTTAKEMILLGKRRGNQKFARLAFLD